LVFARERKIRLSSETSNLQLKPPKGERTNVVVVVVAFGVGSSTGSGSAALRILFWTPSQAEAIHRI
jgi:hypothetical protein